VYVWDYINKVINIQMSINAADMVYTEKSACAEFLYTELIEFSLPFQNVLVLSLFQVFICSSCYPGRQRNKQFSL